MPTRVGNTETGNGRSFMKCLNRDWSFLGDIILSLADLVDFQVETKLWGGTIRRKKRNLLRKVEILLISV